MTQQDPLSDRFLDIAMYPSHLFDDKRIPKLCRFVLVWPTLILWMPIFVVAALIGGMIFLWEEM